MITLKVKRLTPDAVLPKRAHQTDAGLDITATSRHYDDDGCLVYGTGLAVEIPEGHVGLLFPRSSIARQDLMLTNSVGVIDSGYRGEVTFKFKPVPYFHMGNTDHDSLLYAEDLYRVGDRIGQLIVMPIPYVAVVETDTLSQSDRGEGGYGSTGK